MSYCDHSQSVRVSLSSRNFLVNTLASTNIYQSAPNFGQSVCDHKILDEFDYGANRTKTELSALELENLPYMTVCTLASANIDQSVPNLAITYISGLVQHYSKCLYIV